MRDELAWWLFGVPLALFWLRSVIDAAFGMRTLTDVSRPEWDHQPANPKRVSIIVPARDEQEHLERALTALLELDYPNYEVIAVDDRSSDATGSIMDRLTATHPNGERSAGNSCDDSAGWLAGKAARDVDSRATVNRRLAAVHRC